MARAHASTVIDRNVEDVWALVRDFAAVERWIPDCRGCRIDSSDPTAPVRRLTIGDGESIDEVLVARDDAERRIRYAFVSPLPRRMHSFLGTAQVHEITVGNRALLQWTSEFDCDAADAQRLVEGISRTLTVIVGAVAREVEADRVGR